MRPGLKTKQQTTTAKPHVSSEYLLGYSKSSAKTICYLMKEFDYTWLWTATCEAQAFKQRSVSKRIKA